MSAQQRSDEFIKEYLITYTKLPVLIIELIMLELWKDRVFRRIVDAQLEPSTTFHTYTVLYQELIVANVLETVTFHADAMETLGDAAVDLADWCYRSLCALVSEFPSEESKTEYLNLKDEVCFLLIISCYIYN